MGKFYIDINPNQPSVAVSARPVIVVESLEEVPIEALQPVSTMPDVIIQEKIVEKPVEIIREVVVEKIVEVPVEKIVTEIQRVEVPVEVIVEKEIIKEIEVPVEIERLVFREVVRLDTTKLILAIVSSLIVGVVLGKVL